MKIKDGFAMKTIMDRNVLTAPKDVFNGMITLNDTASFIFSNLAKGQTPEEIVKTVANHFDVSEEKARDDVQEFCAAMLSLGVFE